MVGLLFLLRDLFAIPALGSDHAHAGIFLSPDDRGRAGRATPAARGERLGVRRPRRVGIHVSRDRPIVVPSERLRLVDTTLDLVRHSVALLSVDFAGPAYLPP